MNEELKQWAERYGAAFDRDEAVVCGGFFKILAHNGKYLLFGGGSWNWFKLSKPMTLDVITSIIQTLGYCLTPLDPLADATDWPGNTEQYPKQYFVTKLRNVISTNIAGNTLSEIQAHAEALLRGVEYQRRKARQPVS